MNVPQIIFAQSHVNRANNDRQAIHGSTADLLRHKGSCQAGKHNGAM